MTDQEFIKILRISDEAVSRYAADRLEALLGKIDNLEQALYWHHWAHDCQCLTLGVLPDEYRKKSEGDH